MSYAGPEGAQCVPGCSHTQDIKHAKSFEVDIKGVMWEQKEGENK